MKNLKLALIAAVMFTMSAMGDTISHGRVTDKGLDMPRKAWYPFIGPVDVNRNVIYWLKVDKKWHRVTQDEYNRSQRGQFFSRKTDHTFLPQF